MKIRSLTLFTGDGNIPSYLKSESKGKFSEYIRTLFDENGYPVQTLRMATPPFPLWQKKIGSCDFIQYVIDLEQRSMDQGIDYISLGPALPADITAYQQIPICLQRTRNTFFSGIIAAADGKISLTAIRECAKIILELSRLEPNGFGNLYFAALANVNPGAPFFPAAYSKLGKTGFALAMEAADLVVTAICESKSLEEAKANLIRIIEHHAHNLTRLAETIVAEYQIPFWGIDFTPAPYVIQEASIGEAMERLGIPAVGLHGSLAAAAFITDTIDKAEYKKIGFNGLMLPVLEDYQLAQRASDGILTVKDLLLYSCVCGTGLDTIPLPGDASEEALTAVLIDLAALSVRLGKPLTARLMPIPGKQAGEMTSFDFPFFRNSRVLSLESKPLFGLFAKDESLIINKR